MKLLEIGRNDGQNIAICTETLRDATGNGRIAGMTFASAISDLARKAGIGGDSNIASCYHTNVVVKFNDSW